MLQYANGYSGFRWRQNTAQSVPDNWFDQEEIPPTAKSMPVSSLIYRVIFIDPGNHLPGFIRRL